MNKKQAWLAALAVGILILIIGAYAFSRPAMAPAPQNGTQNGGAQPQLTREEALALLGGQLLGGDCKSGREEGMYASCTLTISETGGRWIVALTYSGLFDDSVRASRTEATVMREDGQWKIGAVTKTYQCGRPDSGPEFITGPCP